MIRLTYISTARRGLGEGEVAAILASSRRNNRDADVTGMLLFDGVRFLQALEGAPEAVAATYARIKADARHRACVQLDSGAIATRAFAGWDMAWRRVAPAAGDTLADRVDAMVAEVPNPSLRALFTSFARIERTPG